jgi:copper ion binding protein
LSSLFQKDSIYSIFIKRYVMKTKLKIEGMSCEHCVKHITNALKGIAGVQSVQVSLKEKSAEIEHGDEVSLDVLKAAVTEEGYEVA